jgi:hypothetical protein
VGEGEDLARPGEDFGERDMATEGREPVDLVAEVAVLVSVLMEPKRKSALGILPLHPFGRKGRVAAVDMAHKGGGGPASICGTASRHSTKASSTPFFRIRVRISWEAS